MPTFDMGDALVDDEQIGVYVFAKSLHFSLHAVAQGQHLGLKTITHGRHLGAEITNVLALKKDTD